MLFILFNILFSLASLIALLFISIPSTDFAFDAIYIPIVPVPQYKSRVLYYITLLFVPCLLDKMSQVICCIYSRLNYLEF